MDSRFRGKYPNSLFLVDSRFRGNDGKRRLERVYCLDVPFATAGTDPLTVARFRGNDAGRRPEQIPSFP